MADQVTGFSTLQDVGSVALSSTANKVVAVPAGTNKLVVQVGVKYAAVAGTSGVAVSFTYSLDGSSYTASGYTGSTIAPAAGALGVATYEIGIEDRVTQRDPACVLDYKVILTNADGTNAASYSISTVAI